MQARVLSDTLLARAEQTPDAVCYESVDSAGQVTAVTYAQLHSRACALAEQLATVGDGPVLLAYPPGLDYATAVFGGFLARRPVIPAFPPGPSSRADCARLDGIVADARPAAVLAPRPYDEIAVPVVLAVPGAEADAAARTPPRRVAGDEIAIIQYTSGSTGRPRGVLVRHDSLAANTVAIAERFGLTPDSRGLTWLPPFHDMGLVGGLMTPVTAGIPTRIMAPADFLKAPLWWLRQVSEAGITHTGGPNFAYELCLRRASSDSALAGLDLSRWQVAYSGGETVRQPTMARFAERFASAGFRAQAFLPCYGLAEATLMVTGGHWPGPPATGGAVSCGTPVPGQQVVIVDPQRLTPVPEGVEGEIWIAGPGVTRGYLSGSPGDLFGELGQTRFLRSGDLGHLRGGELFVTGRIKDVIVFRGANYHAEDVEAAALDAAGREGRTAAAFLVESGPEPLPVLLLEARRARGAELVSTVSTAVLSQTGLRLGLVALVPPRSLPRTSSGKIRRSAARDAFVSGAFDDGLTGAPGAVRTLAASRVQTVVSGQLTTLICGIIAGVAGASDCQPTDSLPALGIDSLRAAEAAAVLEHALGLPVPLETLLAEPTPEGAANALMAVWLAAGQDPRLVGARMATASGAEGV